MPLHHGLRAAAGASPADPYFSSTSLLLLGNGSNGGQNNTFVDSSANNFTITRNGNTTQGSFSPFSAPDGRWSNYFDGDGDYLSIANNAALQLGSGDYTVEAWVYLTRTTNTYNSNICGTLAFTGSDVGWSLGLSSTGYPNFMSFNTGSGGFVITSSSVISANTWVHLAVTRSGTTVRLFMNGTQVASTTSSLNETYTGAFVIGSNYVNFLSPTTGNSQVSIAGNVSNIRILKGTAQYSSAFTVPTAPLTAITNTSLLTCQSNRFKDNSSNAFTITPSGNAAVTSFSPFAPLAEYSAGSNGGSGYFDGNGDYISAPASSAFAFGTGALTVEAWIYLTAYPSGYFCVATNRPYDAGNNSTWVMLVLSDGTLRFGDSIGLQSLDSSTKLQLNRWYHIAACRVSTSSNQTFVFINGTVDKTGTVTRNFSTTTNSLVCGWSNDGTAGNYLAGYLSNLRILKGTAQYTTTFTPPTSPLTAITNTSLLLNFTNASIIDSTSKNDLETVGDAQISTSVKKFGTGSMKFDGTGDYCVVNGQTSDFAFGTGDFTIEFWLYINTASVAQIIYDGRPSGVQTTQPCVYVMNDGTIRYYVSNLDRITGSTLSTSTWYHIALARSGTSTKLFVNGTQSGSTYTDSTNYTNTAGRPVIGVDGFNGVNELNGYIDDFRITKGVARYTAAFTPPSAQLPAR